MRYRSAPSVTVVLVVAILIGAACGDDNGNGPTADTTVPSVDKSIAVVVESTVPDGSDEFIATVAEQRAKWEGAGIDTYEFTFYWGVFTLLNGSYRVTVLDGQPAGIDRIGASEPGVDSLDELPGSIEEVFDHLERQVGADRVDVQYDPDLGYPVSVRVDWMNNAVDDEFEMRISDFTVATT